MIQDEFDRLSEEFKRSYRVFSLSLTGLFNETIAGKNPDSPKAIAELNRDVRESAISYYQTASILLEQMTKKVVEAAEKDYLKQSGVDNIPIDVQIRIESWYKNSGLDEIRSQVWNGISRDITTVNKEIRRFAFSLENAIKINGIDRGSALVRARSFFKPNLTYKYVDRANRKWPTERYIGTTIRGHLLTSYNETMVILISEFHDGLGKIIYKDKDHKGHGEIITTVLNGSDLRDYETIRQKVFHPNSTAVIGLE